MAEAALPALAPITGAGPVPKGHGHECWRLETREGRVMLKLALRATPRPLAMANLAEALRLAEAAGIAAPRLRWYGTAPPELESRPMLIQDFLPGVDGEEALRDLAPPARRAYFEAFGAMVARMHGAAAESFSSSLAQPNAALPTWEELVARRLRDLSAINRAADVISLPELRRAAGRISDRARRVADAVRPALVHCDLYPPNTLVDEGRFSALLDFEHAKLWDPVHDFVKLGFWMFEPYPDSREPFLAGYGRLPDRFDERLDVCLGLELLAGFPYWKRHGEETLLADWKRRFAAWL